MAALSRRGDLSHGEESEGANKTIALIIIRLYSVLPERGVTPVLGNQILKSGTSVRAHYREAQRAKSNPDFISKIEGSLQEPDETMYWLELLADAGVVG